MFEKKIEFRYIVSFTLLLALVFLGPLIMLASSSGLGSDYSLSQPNAGSSENLPDKIYTFTSPQSILTFFLDLAEDRTYLLYIAMVSPHVMEKMSISVKDPEGDVFPLFEANLSYFSEFSKWWEIPFGTVMEGGYEIIFNGTTEQNCNIHIQMTDAFQLMHDKLSAEEVDHLVFYKSNKFANGVKKTHDLMMKSDTDYTICVARVNSLSAKLNPAPEIKIDFILEDPQEPTVPFRVYDDHVLPQIDQPASKITFGTATEGVYKINLTVYCNVECVNIGYTISEGFEITEGQDANHTEEEGSDESSEQSIFSLSNNTAIPLEFFYGSLGFVGAVGVILAVVYVTVQKKSDQKIKR
jgi:hypothetical protein